MLEHETSSYNIILSERDPMKSYWNNLVNQLIYGGNTAHINDGDFLKYMSFQCGQLSFKDMKIKTKMNFSFFDQLVQSWLIIPQKVYLIKKK